MADRRERIHVDIVGAQQGTRDLNQLGDAGEDVADAFTDVARRAARMATDLRRGEASADDLGGELQHLAADAAAASINLRRTAGSVDELGDEIGELGRAKLGKALAGVTATGVEAGVKMGASLASGVASAFSGLASNPIVLGAALVAGTALAAAIAAPIGGIITAAILLAIGGGVLAPGIIAAVKSSRIDELLRGPTRQQGTGLGRQGTHRPPELETVRTAPGVIDKLKEAFANFGKVFEGPTARAIQTFSDALVRAAPRLALLAAQLSPLLDKLAPALVAMGSHALPGLERAAVASLPLFEVLAEHGPAIGDAIGAFANGLADAAPYAAVILDDFLQLVEYVLPKLGGLLELLSKLYVINTNGPKAIADSLAPLLAALGRIDSIVENILRKLGLLKTRGAVLGAVGGGGGGQGIRFLAGGGDVAAGEPVVVGDGGRPEVFIPRVPGTVLPRVPSPTGAGRAQQVTLRVVGDDRALVDLIKRLVVISGGGSVQAAFGR